MVDFSNFNNLFSLTQYFNNDEVCKNAIIESRWGKEDGTIEVVCPYCGSVHVVKRTDGRFRCKDCKRNFSCLVGTIFQNTNVSLVKWFMAMYLISSHKKGISSCQLSRDIKVTQTTAWYMLQKVRTLFVQTDETALEESVECDEVYIGGKEKWKHASMRTPNTQGRSTATKTPVFGMCQRGSITNADGELEQMSWVRAFVVDRVNGATILPIIQQFIAEGSYIITDECNVYNRVTELGYHHMVVNHGEGEYVNEENPSIYTNGIEGFWSHFRRMILGCYHDISDYHLQSYINEAVYRWNTRKESQSFRFDDMFTKAVGTIRKWTEIKGALLSA